MKFNKVQYLCDLKQFEPESELPCNDEQVSTTLNQHVTRKSNKMAESTEVHRYLKRAGTSGVRGHLYETKLLSLIYFRLLHDDNIEQFYLGTNIDKLGSFDDICFRAKFKDYDNQVAVFIQAKHRENNTVLTLNNKTEMEKHFKSFLEIRKKIQTGNKDKLFEAISNETKCLCVIYTTANGDKNSTIYDDVYAEELNALIATGDGATKPVHDTKDIVHLCQMVLEEQMYALARKMAKCIHGEIKNYQELSLDEDVLRYHVILAQTFFNVSDDQINGFRTAYFKEDFLEEDKKGFVVIHFKDELCTEIFKRRKSYGETCTGLDDCTFKIEDKDIAEMYSHIASSIMYKIRKFEFINTTSSEKHELILDKINSTQRNRNIALKTALLEFLPPNKFEFKVPAWFGNKDLTLRDDEKKQERKINDLTSKIVGLIKKSSGDTVVIDESMGKGFLKLSGGIASAVGNLLVKDPFSSTIKFTTEYDSLGPLAKRLYDKLQAELKDLRSYRFDINVQQAFPKLSISYPIDIPDENEIYGDLFFDSLLFYTSQLNEKKVEETLIYEISQHLPDDVQNEEITSNAIYLKYHDNIQKWWMSKDGTYLSKEGTKYKDAVEYTTGLPLTSVMNMMEKLKNEHYDFNENAIHSIPLAQQPSRTIILTDSTSLTIAKLAKQLNYKNFIVLDLKYILNLTAKDDKMLREELTNVKESKTIIIDLSYLLQKKNCLRSLRKLQELEKSIQRHKYVIVTEKESIVFAEKCFPNTKNVVKDTTNNLIDMSEETRTNVLENTQVIFLGNEVTLFQIIDEKSIAYVGGSVLNKLMLGDSQTLTIGQSIRNSNYKRKLYLERRLKSVKIPVEVQKRNKEMVSIFNILSSLQFLTLKNIDQKLVVIVGDAGIGKSTFLTHLSHTTMDEDQDSWILRINLIEHCLQFSEWQDRTKGIDILESVKFLCQMALSKNRLNYEESYRVKIELEQSNGLFYLKDCSDDWAVFELKMFLHYYNTKRVLILLDGFDEICPTYENEVTTLINTLQNENWPPDGHKIWITSRTVGNLESSIGLKTGMVYELEPLSGFGQHDYLITYWDEKDLLKDLNDQRFENIYAFVRFMSASDNVYTLIKKIDIQCGPKREMAFLSVYLSLVQYLNSRLENLEYDCLVSYEEVMENLKILSESISKVKIENFVAIPLHLNMIADYLLNKIRETDKISDTWDLNTNVFDIYESFLENKLKIRFQEKNKIDLFTPDNKTDFEEKYARFIEKHKKFGAYAVFGKTLFDEDQLKSIVQMVDDLKLDFLKTGVITNVVNKIPVFIHSSFADYFAVEYICDLFKTEIDRRFTWDFILNVMFFSHNVGIITLFDAKMKTNQELVALFNDDNEVICDLLLNQNVNGDIRSSLAEAVKYNLRTIGVFLCSTVVENLTASRLTDFIKIVKDTKIVITAIKMEFEEIIVKIVNLVKQIDPSKLVELFENFKLSKNIEDMSTDELIQILHRHVWTRMDIVPDWSNVSQFSGKIQFI